MPGPAAGLLDLGEMGGMKQAGSISMACLSYAGLSTNSTYHRIWMRQKTVRASKGKQCSQRCSYCLFQKTQSACDVMQLLMP